MKKILLAGFGNIGYRYAEGLSGVSDFDIDLNILEPNRLVFKNNLVRLTDQGAMKNHKISHIDLEELSGAFDLAIVSTDSKYRLSLVSQIKSKSNPQNWILEKVLARSVNELDQIAQTIVRGNAWVNTPRRLTSIYKLLKSKFCKEKIKLSVRVKSFAIGCNAIHFIDTVCWLTGEDLIKVEVEASSNWHDAKRTGYKEFTGTLRAYYEKGSVLLIDNVCDNINEGIFLETEGQTFHIDETHGVQIGSELYESRMEYQSELTADLVKKILMHGKSELPTLSESIKQHRLFFSGIMDCKRLTKFEDGFIPIT